MVQPGSSLLVLMGRSNAEQKISKGICRYQNRHRLTWNLHFLTERELDRRVLVGREMSTHLLGIISFFNTDRARRLAVDLDLPAVGLAPPFGLTAYGHLIIDQRMITELVLAHARHCGVQTIGLVGDPERRPDCLRLTAESGESAGFTVKRYTMSSLECRRRGLEKSADILQWIRHLPRPCLLFAAQDREAVWLRDLCQDHDMFSGSDLFLLGVGNDEWICNRDKPNLSSVIIPWILVGEKLSLLMHRLLNGAAVESETVKPVAIMQRESTRGPEIKDPLVLQAIKHLEKDPAKALSAIELADELGVVRQTLYRRFRRATGKGTESWWLEYRLAWAEDRIRNTHESAAQIARTCGFKSTSTFRQAFRRRFGCGPGDYRIRTQ